MRNCHEYPFEVKVVQYEDNVVEYEVKFFDFDMIIGVGDSVSEAIEEAYYNLSAYLEYCSSNNIQIPEPSKNYSLDKYSGKMTIRLPKKLHKDFVEFAEKDGMSINSLAIDAFRSYLSNESLKSTLECVEKNIESAVESAEETTKNFIKFSYTKQPKVSDFSGKYSTSKNILGDLSYAN